MKWPQTSKNKYSVLLTQCLNVVFMLDTGQVRDWFGGMGRFSCKG